MLVLQFGPDFFCFFSHVCFKPLVPGLFTVGFRVCLGFTQEMLGLWFTSVWFENHLGLILDLFRFVLKFV